MAITLKQAALYDVNAYDTLVVTYGSALTSGTRLVAVVQVDYSPTDPFVSLTDDVGGIWARDADAGYTSSTGGSGRQMIFSRANIGTTAVAVTLTKTSGADGILAIYELTASGNIVLDSTNTTKNQTGGIPETLTLTTLTDNCAVFAVDTHYNNTGVAADTGYTLTAGPIAGTGGYKSVEYILDAGAAGSEVITFQAGSPNAGFAIAIAAYKVESLQSHSPVVWTPPNPKAAKQITVVIYSMFDVASTNSFAITSVVLQPGDLILIAHKCETTQRKMSVTDNAAGGSNVYNTSNPAVSPSYYGFGDATFAHHSWAVAKAPETVTVTVAYDGNSNYNAHVVFVFRPPMGRRWAFAARTFKMSESVVNTHIGPSLSIPRSDGGVAMLCAAQYVGTTWTARGRWTVGQLNNTPYGYLILNGDESSVVPEINSNVGNMECMLATAFVLEEVA